MSNLFIYFLFAYFFANFFAKGEYINQSVSYLSFHIDRYPEKKTSLGRTFR